MVFIAHLGLRGKQQLAVRNGFQGAKWIRTCPSAAMESSARLEGGLVGGVLVHTRKNGFCGRVRTCKPLHPDDCSQLDALGINVLVRLPTLRAFLRHRRLPWLRRGPAADTRRKCPKTGCYQRSRCRLLHSKRPDHTKTLNACILKCLHRSGDPRCPH